jgi:hypothetical protein
MPGVKPDTLIVITVPGGPLTGCNPITGALPLELPGVEALPVRLQARAGKVTRIKIRTTRSDRIIFTPARLQKAETSFNTHLPGFIEAAQPRLW